MPISAGGSRTLVPRCSRFLRRRALFSWTQLNSPDSVLPIQYFLSPILLIISISAYFYFSNYAHLPVNADHFLLISRWEYCCRKRLRQKLFYRSQHRIVIISFVSIFWQNVFHFFCIASSLPKVITCSNCSTVFEGPFQSFRQCFTVEIELSLRDK